MVEMIHVAEDQTGLTTLVLVYIYYIFEQLLLFMIQTYILEKTIHLSPN